LPISIACIGAVAIFALFLAGKSAGLLAVPLVAVVAVLLRRGGYIFAWVGLLLTCATNVKYGYLAAGDLFLIPSLVLAIAWLIREPVARRPRVPGWLLLFGVAMLMITGFERIADGISDSEAVYALRMVLIVVGMPVLFMVHGRTTRRFEGLLGAYVLSSAANGLLAGMDAYGFHYASGLTGNTGFLHSDRFSGLSTHTTQLGMISVLAVPMLVYLARKNWAWYLAAPPTLVGILASGSRGALIGLPVALLALALCERKYRVRAVVTIGVLGVILLNAANALGLQTGLDRLLGTQSAAQSDQGRAFKLSSSLHQIADRPFFGYGFGVPYSDNAYLAVLRAGGLVIGLPLIVLWLWSFVMAQRAGRPIAFACAASTATWLVLNVQFNGLYERYLWVPFGASIAIATLERAGVMDHSDEADPGTPDGGKDEHIDGGQAVARPAPRRGQVGPPASGSARRGVRIDAGASAPR
jgi:O-Antigen ligase